MLINNNHENTWEYLVSIQSPDGKEIVRVLSNGNVEIFGDVNEAARIFWLAVSSQVGGDLIHTIKDKIYGDQPKP